MTTPTVDSLAHADQAGPKTSGNSDSPLPNIHSHQPRWLDPEFCFIHLGNLRSLHLSVRDDDIYRGLFAVRCLPVHHPFRYISLRCFDEDKHEVEVILIRDLSQWPEQAQELIRQSLRKRYFVHTITSIKDIRTYNGYLNFIVDTDMGRMDFMLRWQHDRAHDYGVRGNMLLDTEDNRYLIPDVVELAPRQRNLFQRHIYW